MIPVRVKAVLFFTIVIMVLQISMGTAKAEATDQSESSGYDGNFTAYMLCDSASGQVIAQKSSDTVIQNVGMSQLMTVLIVLDAVNRGEIGLKDQVKISDYAAGQGGSQIFLEQQDNYTVETLLKGLIMVSANDACMALAERLSGSEEAFVARMNEKAKELGMTNTKFVNCTGYLAMGETTTAKDMVALSRQIVKYPLFFQYSKIWMDTIVHNDSHKTDIVNANRLVKVNDKCDGIGVGSSKDTGFSLAVTGKSGDSRFVFVGIGAKSAKARTSAANAAMEEAFNTYTSKTFLKAGQLVKKDFTMDGADKKQIMLYARDDISLLLKKGEENTVEKKLEMIPNLELPIRAGDKVGEVVLYKNGQKIAQSDIIVREDVYQLTYLYCLRQVISQWLK
ncbi:MAG: D-alanyl-D-alanine carboxypeptidase family protein [Eubacteriales bacterium]